jgi:hypothetical protein
MVMMMMMMSLLLMMTKRLKMRMKRRRRISSDDHVKSFSSTIALNWRFRVENCSLNKSLELNIKKQPQGKQTPV